MREELVTVEDLRIVTLMDLIIVEALVTVEDLETVEATVTVICGGFEQP